MQPTNIAHINKNYGWFLGSFADNQLHKHYAIQLSIAIEEPIRLSLPEFNIETDKAIFIQPNVAHQLSCKGNHLLVLINPTSSIGHFWHRYSSKQLLEIDTQLVKDLKLLVSKYLASKIKKEEFIDQLNCQIQKYDCHCEDYIHSGDERIEKAIDYLNQNSERVVPLTEIAEHCHLSTDRFQHLFREITGQTYRRAQLWVKLMTALLQLKTQPLTTIAHNCGFADSAHFSRTFKESFGFSPREFLKLSQFVQV
ncbi:MAG: hypothetical protein CMO01_02740 [Thalassobius sp.]|nr:hypothetical protein [Thalassovita sp.]